MRMPRIWEILNHFKRSCALRGWKTSENEDWIELDNDYHSFLCARDVTPASFKAIISNRKCVVRKGLFYTVVEPSHLAWLFSEAPPEELARTVLENPDLSKRVAIFNMSPMLEGKDFCIRLNNTDSLVFHEFEAFLQAELKVKVESALPPSGSRINTSEGILPQLA
jgi:hypothetical protein